MKESETVEMKMSLAELKDGLISIAIISHRGPVKGPVRGPVTPNSKSPPGSGTIHERSSSGYAITKQDRLPEEEL